MNDIIKDLYEPLLENEHGFIRVPTPEKFNQAGVTWQLPPSFGEGYYWVYSHKNLFDIKIHDFYLHNDSIMEFNMPECLSISLYESISGEELNPYRRLNSSCIKSFIGGYKPYRMLVHKKVPIKSIGIEIMPAFYENYLAKQYAEKYVHPLESFQKIDQTTNFPEMEKIFFEIKNHVNSNELSTVLFYESKVNEAMSLILNYSENLNDMSAKKLTREDLEALSDVIDYINDHYAFNIPLERLAKIACMGTTKLKTSFKEYKNCTITEYIQERRMAQAEHLLLETDLTIHQIAQIVGYSTSSRFASLFKKMTGLLPSEYKEIAKK